MPPAALCSGNVSMNSPPATPLKQPNPNAAMDAKTMAAAAGAAGVAAAIACSKTCAADAGGGDTVRHLYRAPGLPPPRVVAAKKTCEELGIPPSAITTVRPAPPGRCPRPSAERWRCAGGLLQRHGGRRCQRRVRAQRPARGLLPAGDVRPVWLRPELLHRAGRGEVRQGDVDPRARAAAELHNRLVHERRVHPARCRRAQRAPHRGAPRFLTLPSPRCRG